MLILIRKRTHNESVCLIVLLLPWMDTIKDYLFKVQVNLRNYYTLAYFKSKISIFEPLSKKELNKW